MDNPTPLERRQGVFAGLVKGEGEGHPVKASWALAAGQCDISVQEAETIEKEGLMRQWPPLG